MQITKLLLTNWTAKDLRNWLNAKVGNMNIEHASVLLAKCKTKAQLINFAVELLG